MNNKLSLTFVTLAGIFFVSGIVILIMSVSLLFSGLAFTVVTLKQEDS